MLIQTFGEIRHETGNRYVLKVRVRTSSTSSEKSLFAFFLRTLDVFQQIYTSY